MNWINPAIFKIGPISIHWYGLMYVLAFSFAYLFLQNSKSGKALKLNHSDKDNLLICAILGIILGGRIGYILFYNFNYYLNNWPKIFAIWEGGLSFHGGLIGVITTFLIYIYFHNKKSPNKIKFLEITDITVLIAPIGIFLGRIGNFINGELYGRINKINNICFNFPTDPSNCRYPSQLFEAFGEGFFLFIILYLISKKITKPGILSSIFLLFYGLIRFIIEYFREPDSQIGYILGEEGFLKGLSLGQILSLLTAIAGLILIFKFKKNKKT